MWGKWIMFALRGGGGVSVERVCLKAEQKGAGHCLYYDAKHLRFAN